MNEARNTMRSASQLVLGASGVSVALVLAVVVWARQRDVDDQAGTIGPEAAQTHFAQTLAAMTPDLTVAAESAAAATRIAVTMQATGADPTEPPAEALATAHAEWELADRLDGVQIAMDILQRLEPPDPGPYEGYIVAAANLAATSPLPFPFSGEAALPDPDVDLEAYRAAVYADDFKAACELDPPPRYELCARDAFIDHPTYTRALVAVSAAHAVPLARTALGSPNKLVFDAAVHVLCWHADLESVPAIAARVDDFDWPLPDIGLASSLLLCADDDADALALEALDGDDAFFRALDQESQRMYGR